jgi:hypothetical protein
MTAPRSTPARYRSNTPRGSAAPTAGSARTHWSPASAATAPTASGSTAFASRSAPTWDRGWCAPGASCPPRSTNEPSRPICSSPAQHHETSRWSQRSPRSRIDGRTDSYRRTGSPSGRGPAPIPTDAARVGPSARRGDSASDELNPTAARPHASHPEDWARVVDLIKEQNAEVTVDQAARSPLQPKARAAVSAAPSRLRSGDCSAGHLH